MNVGIYFDLRNPPAWAVDPARLYGFTLELCEEADRLGIDSLWFTEHHKFDDGYLSQPLTFAAAVAARTTRARLGTAVLVAPLHHPVRLAEEAALVDLISNGRLDIGLGAGYRKPEYDLYGASMAPHWADYAGKSAMIHCSEEDGLSAAPGIKAARTGIEEMEREGRLVRRLALPRVELRYVVTAWTSDHGDERAAHGFVVRAHGVRR